MNEEQREEVALFRFGVISDLVCSRLGQGEMAGRIRQKSSQRWHIPYSGWRNTALPQLSYTLMGAKGWSISTS